MRKHWNDRSAVKACGTCDGEGRVHSHRRATINDPYPTDICPDCDGPHLAECPVCGFGQQVKGADCLACETVAMLWPNELAELNPIKFAAAIMHARNAALADQRSALA